MSLRTTSAHRAARFASLVTSLIISLRSPQPLVVCDGNTHSVGVTVIGVGFDTGYAKATATLYGGDITGPVKAKSTRTVYITQV